MLIEHTLSSSSFHSSEGRSGLFEEPTNWPGLQPKKKHTPALSPRNRQWSPGAERGRWASPEAGRECHCARATNGNWYVSATWPPHWATSRKASQFLALPCSVWFGCLLIVLGYRGCYMKNWVRQEKRFCGGRATLERWAVF